MVQEDRTEKKDVITMESPDYEKHYTMQIAQRVKEIRKTQGYSYEQFALHAGINRNTYYKFEKSAKTGDNFTIAIFLKILKGLKVTPKDFFRLIK